MTKGSSPDLPLAGLAHDLNNIFETVLEAAELLANDPNWARLSCTLRRSINHAQTLLGSFCESAQSCLEFERLVNDTVLLVSDLLHLAHGPAIEFRISCDPEIRFQGSPADWQRILLNLLMNCVQAMQEGGIVEIAARRLPGSVWITVSDTGGGIPVEILPKIFEPHFSTKERQSGLGLHIVKSLVEKYGGCVTAENRAAPAGAVFTIRLPVS